MNRSGTVALIFPSAAVTTTKESFRMIGHQNV